MTASALLPTRAFAPLTAVLTLLFLLAACDSAGPPADPADAPLDPGTAAFSISPTAAGDVDLSGPAFFAHDIAPFSFLQEPGEPQSRMSVLSLVSKTASDTVVVTFRRVSMDEDLSEGTAPVAGVAPETASGFPEDGYVGGYVQLLRGSRGADVSLVFGTAIDGELAIDEIRDGVATGSFRFDGRQIDLATLLTSEAGFDGEVFEDGEESFVSGRFSARIVSLRELNRLVGIPTDPASYLIPEYTPW
jgi:hypothetical protein